MKKATISFLIDKIFSLFLSLELLFYWLNKDQYFQLSGFYIFLLMGLLIGIFAFSKNHTIHFNSNLIAIIFFSIQIGFTALLHIHDSENGYLLTYLVLITLFLEIEILGIGIRFQNCILKSYIYGALIIAMCQIIFRDRYYTLSASRITIQLFNNPAIDPNYLGAFMVAPALLCISNMLNTVNVYKKSIYTLYTILILVGIFLTGSRGALLSVILGGSIASFYITYKRKLPIKYLTFVLFLLILGVIIAWKFIPLETFERLFVNDYMEDNGRRIILWKNAWNSIITSNPILGHGIQNSAHINGKITGLYEPSHNTYFDICLQTGFLGMMCVATLLINAFKNKNPFYKGICIGTVVCSVFIGAEACLYFWMNILICLYFKEDLMRPKTEAMDEI